MTINKLLNNRRAKIIISLTILFLFSTISVIYLHKKISKPYCTINDTKIVANQKHSDEEINRYLACKPLIVFFNENVTEEQVLNLKHEIEKEQGVYLVNYVSREDAVKNYKEINKNDPLLIQIMPPGLIFPPSVDIYLTDPKLKDSLQKKIKNNLLVQTAS